MASQHCQSVNTFCCCGSRVNRGACPDTCIMIAVLLVRSCLDYTSTFDGFHERGRERERERERLSDREFVVGLSLSPGECTDR